MAEIPFPRGVRDLMPNEALFANELIKKVELVFQRFGFLTIDTPSFESLKVLRAKDGIGEESQLIYEIKDQDLGLRYDNTVSLARYMAMHADQPLPFKRYYIGKVWRLDEPQKNRYREFVQADIDVIGGSAPANNAEVIAATAKVFEAIGLDYTIMISDRRILEDLMGTFGVNHDDFIAVERTIDKLDKIGQDKVNQTLLKMGVDEGVVRKLNLLMGQRGPNEEKLDYVEALLKDKAPATEMRELLELLGRYGLANNLMVDFSIVRGLQYYTGVVFEFKDPHGKIKSSLAAGGRYDNLLSLYSGKNVPAVGISIGIDRVLDAMDFSSSPKKTPAQVYVAYIKDKNYNYALAIANRLRDAGINTDINTAKRNINNQFVYANSLRFKYVVVVGDAEEQESKLKLKDLVTGEEEAMTFEEALERVRRTPG